MTLHDVFLRLHILLTEIAAHHREIDEPQVRAQIAETIWYYFVLGHPLQPLPLTYGMTSLEGDLAVAHAINFFLRQAAAQAQEENLTTVEERRLFMKTPHVQTLTSVIYGEHSVNDSDFGSASHISNHRFYIPVYKISDKRKFGITRLKKIFRIIE